jgi:cytochrome P450
MPSSNLPPHDRRAFIPFSVGPYNCVGQIFAMMEMKTVIARLVQTFEIELAPGEDGSTLLTQSHDHLTLDPGSLMLSFKKPNIS